MRTMRTGRLTVGRKIWEEFVAVGWEADGASSCVAFE